MLPNAAAPTVADIANLRPRWSASQPNTKPPRGRAAKPTANTINVDKNAETGSCGLKNWVAKNGAKIAKTPQSNHSSAFPTPVPRMVLRLLWAGAGVVRVEAMKVMGSPVGKVDGSGCGELLESSHGQLGVERGTVCEHRIVEGGFRAVVEGRGCGVDPRRDGAEADEASGDQV